MALNERVLEAGSHLPRRLPRKLTTRGGSIRNSLISPGREYARTHAAAERSPAVSARLLMRGSPRLEIELHVDGISFRQRAAWLLFINRSIGSDQPLTLRFFHHQIRF